MAATLAAGAGGMSRPWQALRALRLRLFGPAKELVGTDQFGNKYYRVPKHETRAGRRWGGGPVRSGPAWRLKSNGRGELCACEPSGGLPPPRRLGRCCCEPPCPEPPAGSAQPQRSAVPRGRWLCVWLLLPPSRKNERVLK